MAFVDEDKQATIRELTSRFDQNNSRLKQLEIQRRQSETTLRRAAYTASHLDELPDTVVTYYQIGKAYVLEPKGEVMSHLKEIVGTADRDLKTVNASKEKTFKETESLAKEINELVKSAAPKAGTKTSSGNASGKKE